MSDFAPFKRTLAVPSFSFRWMNANCYQFRLPDGKTFIVDPFFPDPAVEPKWEGKSCELRPKDLEQVDYIFVNHTHGDHIGSLKETYDLFKSRILCHSATAFLLSRNLDIPQQKIFPFENERTYHFPGFTLSTYTARHVGRPDAEHFSPGPDMGTPLERLNEVGTLFNHNFILRTASNLRIGYCAGTFDDTERYEWKQEGINVFLRQMSWHIRTNMMEDIAEDFMSTGAAVMLPLHHEEDYKYQDKNAWAQRFNEYLASKGYYGRLYMPERAKWCSITLGAVLGENEICE